MPFILREALDKLTQSQNIFLIIVMEIVINGDCHFYL